MAAGREDPGLVYTKIGSMFYALFTVEDTFYIFIHSKRFFGAKFWTILAGVKSLLV